MGFFDQRTAAVAIACWALGIGGEIARGHFDITSQTRSVSAQINYAPGGQTLSSSAGGHLDQNANVIGTDHGGSASQSMSSDLTSNLISFSGGCSLNYPSAAGTGQAWSSATATIALNVMTNTDVVFSGSGFANDPTGISGPPAHFGSRSVNLDGPGVALHERLGFPFQNSAVGVGTVSFSDSVTLTPGSYTLALNLGSFFESQQAQPVRGTLDNYTVSLLQVVPEPGALGVVVPGVMLLVHRRRRM